jgi:hypothetical protein
MIKHLLIGGMALGVILGTAPAAHADTTMTAAQICSDLKPGSFPVIAFGTNRGACGSGPLEGMVMAPGLIEGFMNSYYYGAFPVDPNNPFSDWIVPAGVTRGTSKPPEQQHSYACNDAGYCGPEVPRACSGPNAPCG